MASANKSLYLDTLSVKNIFPRGANNTILAQDQILITDGNGGTVWQSVNALTGGGAFTTINTTPSTIQSSVASPFISILNGPNAGLTVDSTAPNTLRLYANAFNQITLGGNIQGHSTLSAYNNPTNTYKSTISFIASDNIKIIGDSSGNTLSFSAVAASNATTSTISSFLTNMSSLNASFGSNLTSFNSPYSAQPFIQYGSTITNSSGQATVAFTGLSPPGKNYTNMNYVVQLTYQYTVSPAIVTPLSFVINSSNAFTAYGDSNRTIYWTTYGQIF